MEKGSGAPWAIRCSRQMAMPIAMGAMTHAKVWNGDSAVLSASSPQMAKNSQPSSDAFNQRRPGESG